MNPLNPGLKLDLASAAFLDGKIDDAKTYANQALSLKQDDVDALVTLSQIAKSQGDNSGALLYAQSALALTPDDKNLIQYANSLSASASTSNTSSASTPAKTKTKK